MKAPRWIRWRQDRELDEEIEAHLDLEVRANLDRGLTPEQARAAAFRRFGNRTQVKERAREGDPFFSLETFGRDALYGLRSLRRSWGFSAAAIVSLALGIGANTLIFSVLDSTLLKPLALPDPDRLVVLWNVPDRSKPDQLGTSSIPRYYAFRDRSQSFESVAAFNGLACGIRNLGFDQDGVPPERILGQTISPSMFQVLGVSPAMGRAFTDDEDRADNVAPVALISHRTWQRRFGGDAQVVGKTLTLNRVPTTVIGVLPEQFDFFGRDLEFFAPLCLTRAQELSRVGGNTIVARLKPGISIAQAQAEVDSISAQLAASDPARHQGIGTRVELLQRAQARYFNTDGRPSGDYRSALLILQGAVAFVLLIACANVAGLLLARTASRRGEVALRLALGAGRWRLVRQLVTESFPLAVVGGTLGVVLSWVGLRLFLRMAPPGFPHLDQVSLNVRVLGFTALIVVVTTVLFAVVPAIQASKATLVDPMRDSGRSATGGVERQRARSLLVTGQVALALVLLIGAGLMFKSFVRVIEHDLGADPQNLLTFDFRLQWGAGSSDSEGVKPLAERYRDMSLWEVSSGPGLTFDRVLARLRTLPGVASAAAVSAPPFGSQNLALPFLIEGRPVPTSPSIRGEGRIETQQTANYSAVSSGFFNTMRIPVLRGRDFSEHDTVDQPYVAIVNQTFASRYFPDADPIGKRLALDFVPNEPQREIVAVVGDTAVGPLQHQQEPAIYVHHLQQTSRFAGPWVYMRVGMTFVLRTTGDPMRMVESVKRAVAEVDRNTPVAAVQTMEQTLDGQIRNLRLYMFLIGIFGGVAALLAATGIYGVMAYSVAERTREIGIRMALGARARDVLRTVLGQATWMIGTGLVAGLAVALAITRVIQSVLVEVTATDPATFGAVTAILASIAAIACVVPTRRATSVDPTVALKFEQ
jgi:putative ABC transport system permease protein